MVEDPGTAKSAVRVLIIDDNPDFLFSTETLLRRNGYEVMTAMDGPSGIERCNRDSPEIVITDIRLPGMDGLEVLRRIREANSSKEVIIVTGYADLDVATRAVQLNAFDFITKPVNQDALLAALDRAKQRCSTRVELIDLLPCYLSIQDRSFQILQVNQTFRNDFGNGVGKKCYSVYKGRNEKCFACPLEKTLADKRVHISEETVQLASGHRAQMIVYTAPIVDHQGRVTAVIEMSTNITRVKEMQKELALLGQSMASLSHDIKNILEGLRGGAYVVDEGLKDRDEDLIRKGWSIVKKNIAEVSNLVQNILYSAKKRKPHFELIRPGRMVKEAVGLFREKAESIRVELREWIEPNLPPVQLDPSGIRRMLANLIWNALEACERDKGKDAHSVEVRAALHAENYLIFEVEDNGVGMDESIRNRIFKESFTTKGSGGTGLGLMVVQEIVDEHGGRIEVMAGPNRGSKFRVTLSLHPSCTDY